MDEEVAGILLQAGAVTLRPKQPYTYASGIKSPIYCDNRLLMSYPAERKKIIDFLTQKIMENKINADVIAGTESAGIPWAAWVADKLNLPMIFVRKKSKDHGKENRIEGKLDKDQHVIVIEDLVSTGGSSLAAVEAVREAGGNVIACLAIFTYEMESAEKNFKASNCPLLCLSSFSTLVSVAVDSGRLNESDKDMVMKWIKAPEEWGI